MQYKSSDLECNKDLIYWTKKHQVWKIDVLFEVWKLACRFTS